MGSALLIAACVCWIVNGVILLGAFVSAAISTVDTLQTNPRITIIRAVRDAATPTFPAIPAMISLFAAGVLFAAGLGILRRGTIARTSSDTGAREVYEVQGRTGRDALVAGILILLYTAAGGIAFVGFALTASDSGVEGESMEWLLAWLAASVVLMVGAVTLSAFGRSLAADTSGLLVFRGFLVTDYAISSLVGLTFFVIASLASTDGALLMEVLGVFSQLLVLPLTGIIVFGTLLSDSLVLRQTRALPRPVHVPGAVTAGTPAAAPSPAADGLVQRLASRIDVLERALREQGNSVTHLESPVASQGENGAGASAAPPGQTPDGSASAGIGGRPKSFARAE